MGAWRHTWARKASHVCGSVLAVAAVCVAADLPLLIGGETTTWPGYETNTVFVPDSVDRFRFVLMHAETGAGGHENTCFALAARCVILNGGGPADLRQAAEATGHPEIPNLPVMSDGANNLMDYGWCRSNFPNQIVGFYSNFPIDASIYPEWAGLFQNQDDNGGSHIHNFGGSGSDPLIYCPNWGWPHGYYGAQTKSWPLYEILARVCIPRDWYFTKGKAALSEPAAACASTEWRGDPTTWHGVWPRIYPKDQYPGGNPGRGVWLPNEDYAWLWRAAVSRHPTQLVIDQGEANFGQTMSNSSCAGQPNIMVVSPSRSYQPHRNGGSDYPLFAINSSIDIRVRNGFHTNVPPYDIAKLEIYDGSHKMGELAPNAYNVYIFRNCILTRPGMRPLIATATLRDGTTATSRPSMIYVTDLFEKQATGVVWRGGQSRAPRAAGALRDRSRYLEIVFGAATAPRSPRAAPLYDIRGRRAVAQRHTPCLLVRPHR